MCDIYARENVREVVRIVIAVLKIEFVFKSRTRVRNLFENVSAGLLLHESRAVEVSEGDGFAYPLDLL